MIHEYKTTLAWTGNRGSGTTSYNHYSRDYTVRVDGKPDLDGSADEAFRGSAGRHNPEDLLLAALSGCHMLAYLALCARRGVNVVGYQDRATGTLSVGNDGAGRFDEVVLSPLVTIAPGSDRAGAMELHDVAHHECFIANSCRMPIRLTPAVHVADEETV